MSDSFDSGYVGENYKIASLSSCPKCENLMIVTEHTNKDGFVSIPECPYCGLLCPECRERLIKRGTPDKPLEFECLSCGKICTPQDFLPPVDIVLPSTGKLVSKFAKEVAEIFKDKNKLFFRAKSMDVVEIGDIREEENGGYTGFMTIKPSRFITLAERYIKPVRESEYMGVVSRKEKSMTAELAKNVLDSDIFQNMLPRIDRIFTVPLPIIANGNLTFPERGYDNRFFSWMPKSAPEISNPRMGLEEARRMMVEIFNEFCFQTKQDYVNAVAALLTPFLRGLFSSFSVRTPAFFYIANRERAGKDYLAGITGIVYEGHALEEPPISTSENLKTNNSEELRKKIMSAMIGGRKRLHFSNNKGFINNAVFEMAVTSQKYSDRVLGRNEELSFDNEMDFSLSGNTGVGFTPDFANRCRFIRLFLDIEDANSRKFKRPNLHRWVMKNRNLILSALYAFVRNWIENGKPKGSIPFTSFPEWAEICGGILEAAGIGNPCVPDADTLALGGDSETMEMKALFELCYERKPDEWMTRKEIKDMIEMDGSLFGYMDFSSRSDQTKFGNKIVKFIGRVLSDIRMVVKDSSVRPSRFEYKFTKNLQAMEKSQIFSQTNIEKFNKSDFSIYEEIEHWGVKIGN